jgi:hypothetical protein
MTEPKVVKVQLRAFDEAEVQRLEREREVYEAMSERTQAILDAHNRRMFELYIRGRSER